MKENTPPSLSNKRKDIETTKDAEHSADLALFVNPPEQAECLLQSLGLAARSTGFCVKDYTGSMCLKKNPYHLHIGWNASEISRQVHIPL